MHGILQRKVYRNFDQIYTKWHELYNFKTEKMLTFYETIVSYKQSNMC